MRRKKKAAPMVTYRIVGEGARRPKISTADKAEAIAAVYLHGEDYGAAVFPVYDKLRYPRPKRPENILANWRKQLADKCRVGDEYTIKVCLKYGIVETEER